MQVAETRGQLRHRDIAEVAFGPPIAFQGEVIVIDIDWVDLKHRGVLFVAIDGVLYECGAHGQVEIGV